MHEQFEALLDELFQKDPKAQVGQEVLGEVLSRVALKAPAETSRVEIASGPEVEGGRIQQRALPQGTVSKAVKVLMKQGLLEDGETLLRNQDGRVLSPLRLSRTYGIAGAKVILRDGYPNSVIAGLTGLDGQPLLLGEPRILSDLSSDPWADVARVIHDEIIQLLRKHERAEAHKGHKPMKLFGVGVEIGAHVHNGQVIQSPGVAWEENAPLADTIAKLFENSMPDHSIPVVLENDVNALAVLATHQMHLTESNLVVVAVFDEGVGGGLVMDGRLRRGGNGMAMEIGHLTVGYPPGERHGTENGSSAGAVDPSLRDFDPSTSVLNPSLRDFDSKCPCGEIGHLDAFATPNRIRKALRVDTPQQAAQAPACMENGVPTRQHEIFRTAGAMLGRGLAHVINIVNPNRLILCLPTDLAKPAPQAAATAYLPAAKQEMQQAAYSTGVKALTLTERPIAPDEALELGVRAAAFCVLNSFIDHAKGLDGCLTRQRRPSRGETAA